MSRTIHGSAHAAIRFFRENPAALSVYLVYVSRANTDNVAWPSIRGLARDTGWGADACQKARQWLIDHSALEEKHDYIRPAWRKLPKEDRQQRINLDQSKYFKPTGGIRVDGVVYNVLYAPVGNECDETLDVRSHRTSGAPDVGPDSTELDSIGSKGDSTEDNTSSDVASKFGFTIGNTAWYVFENGNAPPVVHEVTVAGFTDAMVKYTFADGTVKRCKPNTLWKSEPKLERKTTPIEDAVGECVFSIKPDAPIGKKMAIRLKEYRAEITAPYPNITPDEIRAAFKWKGERFKPSNPVMVVKLIGDYRTTLPKPRPPAPTLTDEQKAAIREEMFCGPGIPRLEDVT
jgi:hypothetical protein